MKKVVALIVIVVLILVLGIVTILKNQVDIKTQNALLQNGNNQTPTSIQDDDSSSTESNVEKIQISKEEIDTALIKAVYNGQEKIEDGIYGINDIKELLMDVDEDGKDEIIKFGNWLIEGEKVLSIYKYNNGQVQEMPIENNDLFFIGKIYSTTDGVYISDIRSDGPESNIYLFKILSNENGYVLKEVLKEFHIHSSERGIDEDIYQYEGSEVSKEEYAQKINTLNANVYVNKAVGQYNWIGDLWGNIVFNKTTYQELKERDLIKSNAEYDKEYLIGETNVGATYTSNSEYQVYYKKTADAVGEEGNDLIEYEYLILKNNNNSLEILINTTHSDVDFAKSISLFKDIYIVVPTMNNKGDTSQFVNIYDSSLKKVTNILGDNVIDNKLLTHVGYDIEIADDRLLVSNSDEKNEEKVIYEVTEENGAFSVNELSRLKEGFLRGAGRT